MSHSTTDDALLILSDHPEGVWGLAFSPDGTRLLVGDGEGTAHVWDVALGEERLRLEGHRAAVSGVAWSRGGKRWLTGGRRVAHLWDATADAELARFPTWDRPVSRTAFLPDGRTAVYACGSSSVVDEVSGACFCVERPAYLVYVDLVEQEITGRFEACTGLITDLEITADGAGILTTHRGASSHGVTLWDTATGTPRQQIAQRRSEPFAVALIPGRPAALIKRRDRVDFWCLETGEVRPGLPEVDYTVSCLAVTPCGRRALTVPALYKERIDHLVTLWDLASGQALEEFKGHRSDVHALTVSGDGRLAASGSKDGTVRLWDLTVF